MSINSLNACEVARQTLLVLDDNPICLALYRHYFLGSEYEVVLLQNPSEALELLKSRPISGIICDLMMPNHSGLDVLEWANLHQDRCFKILVTGSTDLRSIVYAVNEIGVDQILFKPLNIGDFELKSLISNKLKIYKR